MDYSNYFSGPTATSQAYPFMNFADNTFAGVVPDAGAQSSAMDPSLDAHAFLQGTFDYPHFDAALTTSTGLTPLPQASVSPPAQPISMDPAASADAGFSLDNDDTAQRRRSSSEEKDSLTPAQSRRKAQNRAAQRAFRERKERHVRDLEAKLNLLTTTTSSLQSDNERLKLMLQRAQTENEILRQTAASSSPPAHHPPGFVDDPTLLPSASRGKMPMTAHLPVDSSFHFNARSALATTSSSSPSKAGSSPGSDSHLLSASATWDLLQSHPLYLSGAVDIGEVCERLKRMARSDGTGPMFEEDEVRKVIEEVGRSGGDELI